MNSTLRKGQSFLALVLLIGGIVALIGITIAFFAVSFVDSGFGYQASTLAGAAAISGAQDALLRLDRNALFSSGGYTFAVGSTTVMVMVTQGSPSANLITILSTATVSNRTRKVDVVAAKNASTSQMTVISSQTIQ